ncbi:MAG: hypothetical protein CMH27_11010 [Micavibrio sp.]|mgnify:CR=1 FL=1|nr:hypothetical protein [Micavibrio sp.]|tara:strand:- start:7090 stop:7821 length:732 start_codon:yes stop_codon:yes gene_type:complete
MSKDHSIELALEFPEGIFILPESGGIYFMPDSNSDKAYLGYGAQEELHGKIAHNLPTRCADFDQYDVTYEIEDESLLAARLITPFTRSAGRLLDDADIQKIETKLQNGTLTLLAGAKPPKILYAAKAGDDTTVVLVESREGPDAQLKRTLYGGPLGNLKPLTDSYVQGGNSFYFMLLDKTTVALPYGHGGPKPNEPPKFGNKIMAYLDVPDDEDLAAFGIKMAVPEPHLDPFCPELNNAPSNP